MMDEKKGFRLPGFFDPICGKVVMLPEWIIQEYSRAVHGDLHVGIHRRVLKGVGDQDELPGSVNALQAGGFGNPAGKFISEPGIHDPDLTDDVPVEFVQVFGGDPQFFVLAPTDDVVLKLADVRIVHIEFGHITGIRLTLNIPIEGNLAGVFKIEDRVENRLFGQTRGKGFQPGIENQSQFQHSHRTVEDHNGSIIASMINKAIHLEERGLDIHLQPKPRI